MPRSLVHTAILALVACAGPALAQTISAPGQPAPQSMPPGYGVSNTATQPAPASPEVAAARQAARQACAADVAKLCADIQPGGAAVMQCVRQHRTEVSSGCRGALVTLRDARKSAKG